jgi:hypothetical protein
MDNGALWFIIIIFLLGTWAGIATTLVVIGLWWFWRNRALKASE